MFIHQSSIIHPSAEIDDDVNIEITNQANFGALEIGGSSGAFIDLKSPETDDYDARIQLNTSNNLSIFSCCNIMTAPLFPILNFCPFFQLVQKFYHRVNVIVVRHGLSAVH